MKKTLIFEGAGCSGTQKNDVENCRIRTRIQNNKGRIIYFELGGFEKEEKIKGKMVTFIPAHIDHLFYCDSKWDNRRNHSTELSKFIHELYDNKMEYTKENIINFVNEKLDCSFDSMIVDNNLRVHNTELPLCSCLEGEYTPYNDIEININVLDNVNQLYPRVKEYFADYKLSYNTILKIDSLKKYIDQRSETEKGKIPNYSFYARLRFDKEGIITDLKISAREATFCCMSFGAEILPFIIESIKQDNRELSIKEKLLSLGMKPNEIDHHCSDLYILKNEISEKFIDKYEYKQNVTTFRDNIDRKLWYEIPFAYTEYYNNK